MRDGALLALMFTAAQVMSAALWMVVVWLANR
jgi:hypothetical protein